MQETFTIFNNVIKFEHAKLQNSPVGDETRRDVK